MRRYEPKHLASNVAVLEREEPKAAADDISVNNCNKPKSVKNTIASFVLKLISFVLTTLVIVLIGALGIVYLLSKGPSPSATELFVLSVRETSAAGFLADWFMSKEEINTLLYEIMESTGLYSPTELFGDKWDKEDPLAIEDYNQNLLAWFGFEETLRKIGQNFEQLENYI